MYVARAHTVSLAGILMTKREREPEVRSARGGQVRVTTTLPRYVDYVYPLEQIETDNRSGFAHCGDRTRRPTRGSPFATASTADPPTHDIRAPPLTVHVYVGLSHLLLYEVLATV